MSEWVGTIIHEASVTTIGLSSLNRAELRVRFSRPDLAPQGEDLLNYVVDYVLRTGAELRAGQTITYGSSLFELAMAEDGQHVELHHRHPFADKRHTAEADAAVLLWRDQAATCRSSLAEFSPPRPDQLIVVSRDLAIGRRIHGVRYPAPPHMSGWWFLSDSYGESNKDVNTVHAGHWIGEFPSLARYLALPTGYRVRLDDSRFVWFDAEVASQPVPE